MFNAEYYEGYIRQYLGDASSIIAADTDGSTLNNAIQLIDHAQSAITEVNTSLMLTTPEQKRFSELEQNVKNLRTLVDEKYQKIKLMSGSVQGMAPNIAAETSVRNARGHIEEANQVAFGIIDSLGKQRAILNNSMSNLNETSMSVDNTSRVLGRMAKTQKKNKMIMYGIVVLLVVAIIVLIYISF